ncbi:MAG: response regulator [Planctomycetes bacterium]|nr:response regulator [Planctomycetota bacterium]
MAKRILLVDDDSTTRDTLRRLLERYAPTLDLTEAKTGAEAVGLLEKERFDLIISDLMRPGVDGRELHRLVRTGEGHAQIPFLFLTAVPLPPPSDPRDHVLPKPFFAKDLLERVRRILGEAPRSETRKLSAKELEEDRGATRMKTSQFVARRFAKLFEGRYVRILQRTSRPVAVDLIQRHLLFSRVLSEYNLSEYLFKDTGEISIEVEEVPALPGRHALHFFVLLRSENPRIPVERVLIPWVPEFLLARSTGELTAREEVQRTVDYLRAVYLSRDLDIPDEAILGNKIEIDRIEVLAHDTIGAHRFANMLVHLKIEKRRFGKLSRWADEGLEEVLASRGEPALLQKSLVEATLGLEELSDLFPDRQEFTKAAAYVSATSLLVRHAHSPLFRGSECPERILDPADVPIEDFALEPEESVSIDDPLGKILNDDDHWAGLLSQFFFPGTPSPGYKLYAVRIKAVPKAGV